MRIVHVALWHVPGRLLITVPSDPPSWKLALIWHVNSSHTCLTPRIKSEHSQQQLSFGKVNLLEEECVRAYPPSMRLLRDRLGRLG